MFGLAVGVPPMILSVNRGLWLSAGAIFAIVAVRSFLNGRTAPLKMLAVAIVAVAALVAFTPIGTLVGGRLSESDAGSREGIYHEAWQGASRLADLRVGRSASVREPVLAVGRHAWSLLVRDVLARVRRARAVLSRG